MMTHKEYRLQKAKSRLRLSVIKTIEKNSLLQNVKSILLGFSGGADSSVLFDVLLSLREKYGFRLYAIHVNHGIRGVEADRDEEFVKSICRANGIDIFVYNIDIPKIAQEDKKSLELAARDERYRLFEETARSNGIDVIATAHNADDNVETVLYNIIRGTFINGMCGIPYKRDNIIRPLRDITRKDILAYAVDYSIDYITDSTNLVADCTRNKLRLNIIPLIKELNPSIVETINSESSCFSALKSALDDVSSSMNGDVSGFNDIYIMQYIYGMLGNTVKTEQAEKVKNALKSKLNRTFVLDGGRKAYTENGCLITENEHSQFYAELHCNEYTSISYGKNTFCDGVSVYKTKSKNFNDINNFTTTVSLCSVKIYEELYMRCRKEGDGVRINGITKSVKKEFINKKIPRKLRELIPVICTAVNGEEKIVAVPFIGTSDEFRAVDESREYLIACFSFKIN